MHKSKNMFIMKSVISPYSFISSAIQKSLLRAYLFPYFVIWFLKAWQNNNTH